MSVNRLAPLVIPAAKQHTATVIFIHGLGDMGHAWASAVENWRRRQQLDEVKFILPHAPTIPITFHEGMRMPGWFGIHGAAEPSLIHSGEARRGAHRLIQNPPRLQRPANGILLISQYASLLRMRTSGYDD